MAGDVLDRLLASTLARLGSDGGVPDTLLDRLMQRELELLHSIWDGRRVNAIDARMPCTCTKVACGAVCNAAVDWT